MRIMPSPFVITILTLAVLAGPPSAAAVPSAANSVVPAHIDLVGTNGTVLDPAGAFVVVVRDAANVPIVGSQVVVDLSTCMDLNFGTPAAPGVTIDCTARTATAFTGAGGVAAFLLGGHAQCGAKSVAGCAVVRADGIPLATPSVGAFDEDGVNGLDPHDVSRWLCDFGSGLNSQRSDFDNNGSVGINDLQLLLARLGSGAESNSVLRCAGGPVSRPVVSGGAMNLAWSDCLGAGGTTSRTFACQSNFGSDKLAISVIAPSVATQVNGFLAEVTVQSSSPMLPDWWRVEACRAGALTATSIISSCPTPFEGDVLALIGLVYPDGAPNRARFRIMGATCGPHDLSGGVESLLGGLTFSHVGTVGTSACSGCDVPVCLRLERVWLIQGGDCVANPAGPDVLITSPASADAVAWQTGTPTCGATPTTTTSWGSLKARYR